MPVLPGYREQLHHNICADVVCFNGKTSVHEVTRLFSGDPMDGSQMFLVLGISFIVQIDDPDLEKVIKSTTNFCLVVGHHIVYESPIFHAVNNLWKLAKPIKIERNQHFSLDVKFGDIGTHVAENRVIYRKLELEDEPKVEEWKQKKSYATLLDRFNDYEGLKIIRGMLDGVLERDVQ